jgi:hypothetical protein
VCSPDIDKPDIKIPDDPYLAEEQISLASRIAEETKRRQLAAFSDTIATGSRGVLNRAQTTRTIATGG